MRVKIAPVACIDRGAADRQGNGLTDTGDLCDETVERDPLEPQRRTRRRIVGDSGREKRCEIDAVERDMRDRCTIGLSARDGETVQRRARDPAAADALETEAGCLHDRRTCGRRSDRHVLQGQRRERLACQDIREQARQRPLSLGAWRRRIRLRREIDEARHRHRERPRAGVAQLDARDMAMRAARQVNVEIQNAAARDDGADGLVRRSATFNEHVRKDGQVDAGQRDRAGLSGHVAGLRALDREGRTACRCAPDAARDDIFKHHIAVDDALRHAARCLTRDEFGRSDARRADLRDNLRSRPLVGAGEQREHLVARQDAVRYVQPACAVDRPRAFDRDVVERETRRRPRRRSARDEQYENSGEPALHGAAKIRWTSSSAGRPASLPTCWILCAAAARAKRKCSIHGLSG